MRWFICMLEHMSEGDLGSNFFGLGLLVSEILTTLSH